jgi:hypothetical protein
MKRLGFFLATVALLLSFVTINEAGIFEGSKEKTIKKALTSYILTQIKNPPKSMFEKDGTWKINIKKMNKKDGSYFVEGEMGVMVDNKFGGYSRFRALVKENGWGDLYTDGFWEGI